LLLLGAWQHLQQGAALCCWLLRVLHCHCTHKLLLLL
jgi:hypothetical protein